jgi:hypothetical protein
MRSRRLLVPALSLFAAGALVSAGLAAPALARTGRSATHPARLVILAPRGHPQPKGKNRPQKGGKDLLYNGGSIQTAPTVYLVVWGSQWGTQAQLKDPSGELPLLESFFGDLGTSGDNWSTTTTQYCQGVAVGSTSCPKRSTFVGLLGGRYNVIYDVGSAAPNSPSTSALAAEAAKIAAKTSLSPNAQYVILTASGDDPSGFGTSYCAWHSSTTSSGAPISFTNLPYITDAGSACGANFNGLGEDAGITIVAGHEFAESATDPFPSSGWLDRSGEEIGDKCAWNAATADEPVGSGGSFAVQPLWSNSAGGCVQ